MGDGNDRFLPARKTATTALVKRAMGQFAPAFDVVAKMYGANDAATEDAFHELMENIIVEHAERISKLEAELGQVDLKLRELDAAQKVRRTQQLFEGVANTSSLQKRNTLLRLSVRFSDPREDEAMLAHHWNRLIAMDPGILKCILLTQGRTLFVSTWKPPKDNNRSASCVIDYRKINGRQTITDAERVESTADEVRSLLASVSRDGEWLRNISIGPQGWPEKLATAAGFPIQAPSGEYFESTSEAKRLWELTST